MEALMGAVAAIGGALIQRSAAKKATRAQENAANRDIAFQTETRDLIRGDLAPYREGGVAAQRAIDFELGLAARPEVYQGFTATPGYDFRMRQGQDALEASAAARGGLYSGAAMRDALKFGQDYGSNEYGNYFARLGARADTGMNAAQMSGQASQQAAAGVSNSLGNIGNAQAAGAIGSANAITGGIQNMLGVWNYQRQMNAANPQAANSNWLGVNANNAAFNPLFGGKGIGGFV
jgi:hypothetical protein